MFYFYVQVGHLDRDVEFIPFKRELEALYNNQTLQLDYKCEMLDNELLDYIEENYPDRGVKVEVYEDNENGGIVIRLFN